jgi:hypothetical protein
LGRLVDEDHVTWFTPWVWVVDDRAILVDSARTELLEKTDHAARSGTSVDPDCERSILGVLITSFEEPKEVMFVGVNIKITWVTLYRAV